VFSHKSAPTPNRTCDKTAVFSTRKNTGEKRFYFFFIEQIVIFSELKNFYLF
jgi:hypothetical protein